MGSGWEGEGDVDEDKRGIIPRAIRDLFSGAEQRAEDARNKGLLPPEFSVQAQFIELYNEDIVDLLDPAKDPYAKSSLRITEDGCGGVRIVGASTRPVRGIKEALGALRAGALARTTAATNMNSSSSRSHAVFTLMMRQRRLAADHDAGDRETDGETPEQYETLTAKFHFVDLAGSERLKRTAREGISINCGLLALGNVISALGDKSKRVLHVPYRDSKLTRLLQDSLGGNSNTVMIACVSPSDRDFMETLNTLKYANRARNIKNRCVVNQDLTSRTIHQLRQEVARLQLELAEYKQNGEEGWSDVVQENAILNSEVESLRRRVKAMQGTIEQLSARNSELLAEKALGAWAPKDGSPDASDSNAMYEASRRRETQVRTRHDSSLLDTSSIIDDAKRELYKEKELLARSMGELEFQRKLTESSTTIGERERAEGESAGDSDPSDSEDSDSEDDEAKGQRLLSAQLAALSEDIDTKARLVEQLEASQRRLAALRTHYEQRLDHLHQQIKATGEERDKSSQPTEKLKRVKDEYERRNGEEGWSDVVQENAILNSEVESLRRRVKAMQGTIEQLSARNSELLAEKALGAWAPKDGSPDASDSNAMYEASRRRETQVRTRHDSSLLDTSSIIDDAKRELYKEKELLARSMGELEFQRKLTESSTTIGERERAEGESAGDSDPSDSEDSDSEDDEAKGQRLLSAQLAALSEDIDTKARLVEQLEASQRRLAALRTHYEQRLDHLHQQIKATGEERDKLHSHHSPLRS
ncbi:unnamed protein product [Leptidea sinapis]|uniref:Kinesin-like protein n=1 Tax=Leptidea sinapis TaxID=189913 RepID=A0A5E4Q329_9NEOP|nr:unnamed protein product [Leptidea sinapis]